MHTVQLNSRNTHHTLDNSNVLSYFGRFAPATVSVCEMVCELHLHSLISHVHCTHYLQCCFFPSSRKKRPDSRIHLHTHTRKVFVFYSSARLSPLLRAYLFASFRYAVRSCWFRWCCMSKRSSLCKEKKSKHIKPRMAKKATGWMQYNGILSFFVTHYVTMCSLGAILYSRAFYGVHQMHTHTEIYYLLRIIVETTYALVVWFFPPSSSFFALSFVLHFNIRLGALHTLNWT